jgi:hypothetical protein
MIDECRIDVRNQGPQIELEVSAKLFAHPQVYVRPTLDVTADEFDQLRAGNATRLLVDNVTARISKWLQDPDFDLPTVLGLGAAEECRSRIVFNVSSIRDDKLRYELADFPIEMATPKGDAQPLSLHRRVSSIVHQLAKVGRPPASAAMGWPFKVLITRAGPTDLAPVPAAAPIVKEVRGLRPDLTAAEQIQIDVLSTEPGGPFVGPPTREALRKQLSQGYHLLVFLGHGNVQEIPGMPIPTGQLQLENIKRQSDPFEARKVATLLHEFPVPVVLLIGCLTAGDLTADQLQLFEAELPKWLRGSQGVAQALINSTSGVQCAVGMRYRVDGDDARLFLLSFFQSLLVAPAKEVASELGNIEAAVKTARHALDASGKQLLSYAAPVLFRTLGTEPMFPFLAAPPAPCTYEIDKEDQAARLEVWEALARVNWSHRKPGEGGLYDRIQKVLARTEAIIFDEVRAHAALIIPERLEMDPALLQIGPAVVQVPIVLQKSISISRLQGSIVELSQGSRITNLLLSPTVAAAGFELMLGPLGANVLKFEIAHSAGNSTELAKGLLLTAELAIGSATEAVYQVNIQSLRAQPLVPFCGATNAIIVPAP